MTSIEKGKDTFNEILKKSRKIITLIFIFQTILLLLSCVFLLIFNATKLIVFNAPSYVVINAALFGFTGSLVYFSRKSYVYLITNKFSKIISNDSMNEKKDDNAILSTITGYYLYLVFRPFVGLIIGPLIYMLVLTGLTTFINISVPIGTELSRSGMFLIYFLSFVGGHASSDILDYFSKLAKKIVIKYTEN